MSETNRVSFQNKTFEKLVHPVVSIIISVGLIYKELSDLSLCIYITIHRKHLLLNLK